MHRIGELRIWKKRTVWTVWGASLLFCIFCIVRILLPSREYLYEGSYAFETGTPTENTAVCQGISLGPGVYRIELEYDTDVDSIAAWCTVSDGGVFSGGLLTNGEHLYGALGKTGFNIWLFERTDSLQVTVSYKGAGNLTTGSLKIVETKQLWTMLLTAVLMVCAAVTLCMFFYYYDRAYGVSREKKNALFFVMVTGLIASVPYLSGYTITGADLTYHLQRIEGVKDGLLGGQFPVRLEPRWVYDHGYANGIFYCNTFLYFPAVLRLLGFPVSASYNLYCIGLNLATAGISYYCFRKIFGKQRIGILCGALYTLSVPRIYKLVITSAVGEGTAAAFLPLIFYGLYRAFTEEPEKKEYRTVWVPLMLGYAGLVQSHVLSCEITVFVTVCFCLLHIRKVFRKNTFLQLCKGALGALLISLWYLVPFLDYYLTQDVHIKHISARTIQSSGLQFTHLAFHFWTAGSREPAGGEGMHNVHLVGVGLVLLAALAVFLILWFSGALGKPGNERMSFAKKTALLGTLLLLMSMSLFPWDRIQSLHPAAASLVSSLQFPDRFLGWGTVCLVFLFGICIQHFSGSGRVWGCRVMAAAALMGITTSGMYLLDHVNSSQGYFELYNEEGMGFGYISGAEYLIQGTDEGLLTFAGPKGGQGLQILGYRKKSLGGELKCVNSRNTENYADLPLLLYKGYRGEDAGTGESLAVLPGENNLVRVAVPANYDGTIRVYFASPFYWRISELITAAAVAALIVNGCRKLRHSDEEKGKRRHGNKNSGEG